MSKKILAVLLALACVVTVFTACGKKEDTEDNTTTTVDPFEAFGNDETTAAADETTAAADETTAAADETTAAADETTAAADETTAAADETTTEGVKAPETKEEIVAYFNTAINSAKKDSKSITSNYMKHSVAGEITGIPSALDSIGQKLIKDNMGEDESKKNVTWTSAADKNAYFPVEGETYASKLTAADVKEASIKESNGKYMIKIVTVADPKSTSYEHGQGHAPKAFNAVLPSIIDGYIPSVVKSMFKVGSVAMAYPSSTVIITVDAATGHVTHANYLLNWTLMIPLNGEDVVLPFATENDYTINW